MSPAIESTSSYVRHLRVGKLPLGFRKSELEKMFREVSRVQIDNDVFNLFQLAKGRQPACLSSSWVLACCPSLAAVWPHPVHQRSRLRVGRRCSRLHRVRGFPVCPMARDGLFGRVYHGEFSCISLSFISALSVFDR